MKKNFKVSYSTIGFDGKAQILVTDNDNCQDAQIFITYLDSEEEYFDFHDFQKYVAEIAKLTDKYFNSSN